MSDSVSDQKDSVTEVAEESFVRERPLQIERGAVLAGRYQVEEIIGKGGSGVVLRVFDRTVQNVVALKVLKSELARDSKWDKRFSRELRLGRPIQHRNVCRIFDIGEADGHRFLTMELATGGSLRDELKKRPALERPVEERLADVRAAIEGLAAIHATGVVHRDFKPDNLLRMEDGRLVISDFGLATDAVAGPGVTVMIGTPHYMAPEVLAGEPATARSDVWALGVVLHEIVFGRRPERKTTSFDGSTRGPVRPATPLERTVLALCERCLSETAAERPADAGEVNRLFATLSGSPRRRRSAGWRVAAVSAALLTGIAVLVAKRALRTQVRAVTTDSTPRRGTMPVGSPQDWSKMSSVIARFSGRVHCFSTLSPHTVRVVWGTPRRATDVDVETGQSAPANLVPESFQASCPDLSVSSGRLLYAARNAAGVMEIRLSNFADGHNGATVTSGQNPRWLGAQPSFVYMVDEVHAAVFSLATMQLNLLSTAGAEGRLEIADVTVSAQGDRIAITGFDNRADAWVRMFHRDDDLYFEQLSVPLGTHISFGWRPNDLYLTGPFSKTEYTAARLEIDSGRLDHVGRAPGQDITIVSAVGERLAFVSRRIRGDVWSYEGGRHQQLTWDGDVYGAAKSIAGDLLLERKARDGTMNLWLRRANGTEQKVTHGSIDAAPAFAPDGVSWAYVDYASSTVQLCRVGAECRVLFSDKGMPTWPAFAPDGRRLSFVTQMGRTQMKTLSADGHVIAAWDALPVCAGVWSSNVSVWSVEDAHSVYYWAEHNALTGESSGRRVPFFNSAIEDSPMVDCRAQGADPGSALFRAIQVEADERSEIRTIDRLGSGR